MAVRPAPLVSKPLRSDSGGFGGRSLILFSGTHKAEEELSGLLQVFRATLACASEALKP